MTSPMSLTGRVALVTGGGRGLGRGIALGFAQAGADVAVLGRTLTDLDKAAARIRALGRRGLAVRADVGDEVAVTLAVAEVLNTLGRIDILVNNAGVLLDRAVAETSLDDWERVVGTNLRGTFLVTKAVLPAMIRQRSGHIFTIASVGGRIGLENKSAYCASKFGVVGFSKALAKEVRRHRIKVQIVYPYHVDSYGKIDWSREGEEQLKSVRIEDVASVLVYHASQPLRVLVEDIVFDPYLK